MDVPISNTLHCSVKVLQRCKLTQSISANTYVYAGEYRMVVRLR